MNDRAFGSAIQRRRRALGLNQSDIADLAGCSVRFVHSVEAGKATVRLDKLLDVLEVLGLGLALIRGRPLQIDPQLGPRS